MAFRIYTKTGDQGKTSLIGGTRVSKASLRIEAYGTLDELNAYIGWVADYQKEEVLVAEIREIQDRLFTMGSSLATDPDKEVRMSLPELQPSDIAMLEKAIDRMEASLPPMQAFILPGGHPAVSVCHVARCVCRRTERLCVQLADEHPPLPSTVLPYLNRLSDYLFVLARHTARIYQAEEIVWKPRR
jgi:cob(I)alamin adenosyltransferase